VRIAVDYNGILWNMLATWARLPLPERTRLFEIMQCSHVGMAASEIYFGTPILIESIAIQTHHPAGMNYFGNGVGGREVL
jgi:hypothetical protein